MPRLVVVDAVGPRFVEDLQRAWDAGHAVLPLDPQLPDAARSALLRAARIDEPVEPGDALVVATSGTQGEPKLAVLTHGAVAASAAATSERLAVDPLRDRWLGCLPLAHAGGLGVVTRALLTGTPLTVHERFDAEAVRRASADCTLTSLVPAALARIDPAPFRIVLVGGQSPPPDRPANVIATYGMTETGGGIAYEGRPLADVEVRTSDDGELEVRGPVLLRAYRDGRDPKTADGWYATGDLGTVRDGIVSVDGRRGDLIITGGENVWPIAVEHVLRSHPAVADVAVVGRPDPEWGQRVVAVIVPTDPGTPPTLDQLRGHAKEHLHPHAAPTVVEVVAALPRTASGKVRRAELSGG